MVTGVMAWKPHKTFPDQGVGLTGGTVARRRDRVAGYRDPAAGHRPGDPGSSPVEGKHRHDRDQHPAGSDPMKPWTGCWMDWRPE